MDQVGVIAFDSAAKWVQPITSAREKTEIERNIRSIRSGGGTDMYPALEDAYEALAQTNAQLRHVIVLSDGRTRPANFPALIDRIAGARITLSTVAVGPDADQELMRYLAEQGRGRYYFTADPYSVPRIFTRETILAQRSYVVEKEFVPQVYQENQIVKGISDEGFPSLLGYVLTEAKDRAEIVLRTDKEEPLLAVWRFGLGKTAAFTSDAKNRWASNWLGWTGYKKFFPQLTQWIQRSRKQGVLRPALTIDEGHGKITVDAITPEGETVNFLDLQAKVSTPASELATVALQQVAPGRYEGEFEAREVGAYLSSITGENVEPATTGYVVPYSPEYRDFGTNSYLMSQIASLTGGRINPPIDAIFEHLDSKVLTSRDIWYALVIAALMLFILDIAVRRIFIERKQVEAVAAFFERAAGRLVPAKKRAPVPVEQTLAALKERKEAVTRRRAETKAHVAPPGAPVTPQPSEPIPEAASKEKVETEKPSDESEKLKEKKEEELHTTRLLRLRDKFRKEKK
jgi:hypothetical protein